MRARSRLFLVIAAAAAFASCAETAARADSAAPGGLRGLLRARSADTMGRGVLEAGAFSSLHTREDADGELHVFSVSDLQASYGLSNFLEIGLDQTVRGWRSGAGGLDPNSAFGFGDLQASGKLQLPFPWRTLRLGAFGTVSAPTGSRLRGMSTESADVETGGAITLDFSHMERFLPARLHLNGGYRWNRNETRGFGVSPLDRVTEGGFWPPAYPAVPTGAEPKYNDQIVWRVGFEFSTRVLALFTELALDDFANVPGTDLRDNPVLLTQGALLKFRNGLNLKGAVDVSLQKNEPAAGLPELPDWRFTLGLTWRTALTLGDRDHDGVPDKRDACPEAAEDFDGHQDEDGCPDPDNDGDGIPDNDDLAPDLAEDRDGFEDEDGRPDLDNDGDGIRDADDRCPNEPEDFDGDRDTDGCPDAAQAPGAEEPGEKPGP